MAERKGISSKRQFKAPSEAAGRQFVIVESPAKARTLSRYLGPDYVVLPSVGHVRDLPDRNPKGVKDPVPGVDLENDFRPLYEIIKGKESTVRELRKAAASAAGIWLATDLDREGEAIAWHLIEALAIKPKEVRRVVFNAITESEVRKAFQNPRLIDMHKVNAQQARRILDRIVGYQASPLLWRKVAGGLSAGRVQSVAVRLIVDREREIEAFVSEEYWKITGYFTTSPDEAEGHAKEWEKWLSEAPEKRNGKKSNGRTVNERNAWLSEHSSLNAELVEVDGAKFEPRDIDTALSAARRAGFVLEEKVETETVSAKGQVQRLVRLRGRTSSNVKWKVKIIQTKRTRSHPPAPFITSTLQQAAANQLDFTAQFTMGVAQALYEGVQVEKMGSVGLITYMRTDSTHVSPEAIRTVRDHIRSGFGEPYLPSKPNVFASSNKSAQEAHEAIRPTDVSLTPERLKSSLKDSHYRLYRLIWERFLASQMSDAQWDTTTAGISAEDAKGELLFRATGRVLVFDGYYRVTGVSNGSEEAVLPAMDKGQALAALQIDPAQNFTLPPPRYTEASLVRKLEAEGIGRPSTYAQIIQVIQSRKYVEKLRNRFHATDLGKVVTDKLIEAFPEIMQVGYTRDMEQQLDDIEEEHADWVRMLHNFYAPFSQRLEAAYEHLGHARAETQPAPHACPQCGSQTVYRFGRKGRFLSCSKYPKCKFAAAIDQNGNPSSPEQSDIACPACGSPTLHRKGRYGAFLSCVRYPECKGIVNIDKKGFVALPKPPPLVTGLSCPKCGSPLHLRTGARTPWLSCSAFPKCRGRMSWNTLDDMTKQTWEKALEEHEKSHPKPLIRTLNGSPVGEAYRPRLHGADAGPSEEVSRVDESP